MSFTKLELSPLQLDVSKAFYLKTKDLPCFCSDDFRRLNYHLYLKNNMVIGTLFAFWKHMRWVKETGFKRSVVESSHGRRVMLFTWTTRGGEVLEK